MYCEKESAANRMNNSVTLPGIAISDTELPEFQGLGELNIQAGAESGQVISIRLPAISSEILGINNSFVFDRQWRLVGKIVTGTDEKLNSIY